MTIIYKIKRFFISLVSKDTQYSIKKVLALWFSLIISIVVFIPDVNIMLVNMLLIFLAVLLGIRSYDKTNYHNNEK